MRSWLILSLGVRVLVSDFVRCLFVEAGGRLLWVDGKMVRSGGDVWVCSKCCHYDLGELVWCRVSSYRLNSILKKAGLLVENGSARARFSR